MYSRQSRRVLHVPPNYGGSVFDRKSAMMSTPVEDLTLHRPTERSGATYPQNEGFESEVREHEPCECCERDEYIVEEHSREDECTPNVTAKKKSGSLLSPIGELGTEEILLIALALIIFQGGNDPELSLILLALLFIN